VRNLSSFSLPDEVNDDNDGNGRTSAWDLDAPLWSLNASSQLDFSLSELWNDRTQRLVDGFRSDLDLCRLQICQKCNWTQSDFFSSDSIEQECGLWLSAKICQSHDSVPTIIWIQESYSTLKDDIDREGPRRVQRPIAIGRNVDCSRLSFDNCIYCQRRSAQRIKARHQFPSELEQTCHTVTTATWRCSFSCEVVKQGGGSTLRFSSSSW